MTTAIQTEARNATLADLANLLKEQHARKVDIVAPATAVRFKDGVMHVKSDEVVLDADGVTPVAGVYRPTDLCDGDLATRYDVPTRYVRRLRDTRTDLYDATFNGLIHGKSVRRATGDIDVIHPADDRSFLFRMFRGDDGGEGIARAVLSDRYRIVDNLDVLMAALAGVRDAGVDIEIESCDLTERRMQVRVVCPEVSALAPTLLAGYRSPFDGPAPVMRAGWTVEQGRAAAAREGLGYGPGGEPVVFGGFVISNSETGDGKFSITPRLLVQICRNGLTVTQDVVSAVHLGGKMEDGLIKWSDETRAKDIELVSLKARDAVATFLDTEYVTRVLKGIEAKAGAPVEDPAEAVKVIAKKLAFDETTADGILAHFIRGGQMTAGGLLNAATSYAQCAPNGDTAWDIEAKALQILELAA